jgi:hypothetical protein
LKLALLPWREEGRERAFVRFETGPGEQSQMDWGHFGNWGGRRLYGFALTLCYSRMRYIEFTQSQDIHHLLASMAHGFRYFGGVTESVLTDRMKTVLLDQNGGESHFTRKFLQFAAYYGFVPRVCRPYRPETKGKIESTVRFIKQNFWPGIAFDSLPDLNQQARVWMEKVNRQIHSTTREVPYERLPQERLLLLDEQPDYDTSYMEDRRVAKDCMLSYRGNRYSVPFRFAGKTVLVREPVSGGRIEIYSDIKVIAAHRLAEGRGVTFVSDHAPSSLTPAFSHFWIRRRMRRSATRCRTNCIVHSWLMLSKNPRMSASRIQFTRFRWMPTLSASSASCGLRLGRNP